MAFSTLRKGNVAKLETSLAVEKHAKKSALKDAVNGEEGGNLDIPKAAKKALAAPHKQPPSKSDVKAFHQAIDKSKEEKAKKENMGNYKKVLRYVKLDKKCLSSAPSIAHADQQLAECRSYFNGKGGVSMCHLTFIQMVGMFEKFAEAWDVLPMFQLTPGFTAHLAASLAADPTLYDTELQEMLIEFGGFESVWWMRLGANTLAHWRQFSAGVKKAPQAEDKQ
jgi:hypothetical protein